MTAAPRTYFPPSSAYLQLVDNGRDTGQHLRLSGLRHVAVVVGEDGVEERRQEVLLHHGAVYGLAHPTRDQIQRLLLHHTHGRNERLPHHKLS